MQGQQFQQVLVDEVPMGVKVIEDESPRVSQDHGAFEEGKRKAGYFTAKPESVITFTDETVDELIAKLEGLGLKVKKRTFDRVLGRKLQVTGQSGARIFLYAGETFSLYADGSFEVSPA